ncbi:transposase, partial [Streptomyces sp. NRRL S-813]|uniref:transposase n=1 Tax=Streptomyces sp. NRRL S-813 TaxID=1463919 RepID=UPI001F30BE0A
LGRQPIYQELHLFPNTTPTSTVPPTQPSWKLLTLNVHYDRRLRRFIDAQDWITVHYLPPYALQHNPVEGVWSLLRRRCHAHTAFTDPAHLMHDLRRGLRQVQYRPDLIGGCLAGTGLTVTTPHLERP